MATTDDAAEVSVHSLVEISTTTDVTGRERVYFQCENCDYEELRIYSNLMLAGRRARQGYIRGDSKQCPWMKPKQQDDDGS